jgi:hypothetical protein
MKTVRVMVIFLMVIALTSPTGVGNAQDDTPWGEVLNPDGSIRWELLTDLGVVTEEADWMDLTLPGGIELDLDATFHRYVTPSGNVLVLPSPATLFFMALHPQESGLTNAASLLGDSIAILSLLVGPTMNTEQMAQLVIMGYTSPAEFFQAVINGQESIWSIINFTYLFELLDLSAASGFVVHALLLYLAGGVACEDIPGGCPPISGDDIHITSDHCPAPSLSQEPAILAIQKTAPANPLVVGQDPERRGADIQISAEIPPIVLTWYEEVGDPPVCAFDGSGEADGCPGPSDQYEEVLDGNGEPIAWGAYMEGNRFWEASGGEIDCIEHVEVVPEPVVQVVARADLSAESRYWIVNDLGSKYYEAFVHQPRFPLVPDLAGFSTGCDGSGICSAEALVSRVPFADPGEFELRLWVYTQGAVLAWNGMPIPLTPPRVLFQETRMPVYVTLVTLIP